MNMNAETNVHTNMNMIITTIMKIDIDMKKISQNAERILLQSGQDSRDRAAGTGQI
jgi:hypothetical protein